MQTIMVVEDEAMMREELCEMLKKAGYHAICVEEFSEVSEQILQLQPDLVLLDINLPGISGFGICREVKRKSSLPVVVLTSRDQLQDELHALEFGADEYLTKPCRKERLLARIANVLKRFEGRSNLLEGRGFLLDRQTYTLYWNHCSVILPKNQGKLLEVFLITPGETVPKEAFCMALWGTTEYIDENALQVNLTRMKKKMAELGMPHQIIPVRGVGYRLINPGETAH